LPGDWKSSITRRKTWIAFIQLSSNRPEFAILITAPV
jgi:hypothetical protein